MLGLTSSRDYNAEPIMLDVLDVIEAEVDQELREAFARAFDAVVGPGGWRGELHVLDAEVRVSRSQTFASAAALGLVRLVVSRYGRRYRAHDLAVVTFDPHETIEPVAARFSLYLERAIRNALDMVVLGQAGPLTRFPFADQIRERS